MPSNTSICKCGHRYMDHGGSLGCIARIKVMGKGYISWKHCGCPLFEQERPRLTVSPSMRKVTA